MSIISEINKKLQILIKTEYEELTADLLLNDFQKTIFRLKYVDKMSKEDIANFLNIKISKVNNELFIIRQKLAKLSIFNNKEFNVNNASEYDIRKKCRKLGKNKDYENFCVSAFVEKLPNKELANKYNYSLATIKQYKALRKKELSTN